jgi:hypothetical protein
MHPSQPSTPPSCCWDVQELPIEGTSDASLQVASVSSDRCAQCSAPQTPSPFPSPMVLRDSGQPGELDPFTMTGESDVIPW